MLKINGCVSASQAVLEWAQKVANPHRANFIPKGGLYKILRKSGISVEQADKVFSWASQAH